MRPHTVLCAALFAACAPALAQIYRCPEASGRVTIQQAPCVDGSKLDVRPSRGAAVAPAATAASDAASKGKPISEADRLNALTAESVRERRQLSLQERIVPGAQADMFAHREACHRKQAALQAEQYKYVQNLYGKTHAAQIASEMAAAATQCDTIERDLSAGLQRVLQECKALGGCAVPPP